MCGSIGFTLAALVTLTGDVPVRTESDAKSSTVAVRVDGPVGWHQRVAVPAGTKDRGEGEREGAGDALAIRPGSVSPAVAPVYLAPPPSRATADWRLLVHQWNDWDWDRMLRIIECESHGDENVVSPGGHTGAYQISPIHGYSYEEMTDPVISTDIAHDIWLSQGWGAWSCDAGY